MKVILLKDVAKIGRRYEEAEVPDGYALNALIPQGAAQPATAENKKRIAALRARQTADTSASNEALEAALEAFKDTGLTVAVEANDQDHLFEAIKPEAIVAAAAAAGHTLDASMVSIAEPIKALGAHAITLSQGDISGEISLSVTKA